MISAKGEGFAYGVVTRLRATNVAHLGDDKLFDALVETIYLAARNGSEPRGAAWDAREARYHELRAQIGDAAITAMSKIAGTMMLEAVRRHGDLFGEISEALDLSSFGRNATPYETSRATAGIALTGLDAEMRGGNAISIQDVRSGTGGMIVAVDEIVRQMGFDPLTHLRISANDPDPLCWRMTFVACWLYGIPAVVALGDPLTGRRIDEIRTPALVRAREMGLAD